MWQLQETGRMSDMIWTCQKSWVYQVPRSAESSLFNFMNYWCILCILTRGKPIRPAATFLYCICVAEHRWFIITFTWLDRTAHFAPLLIPLPFPFPYPFPPCNISICGWFMRSLNSGLVLFTRHWLSGWRNSLFDCHRGSMDMDIYICIYMCALFMLQFILIKPLTSHRQIIGWYIDIPGHKLQHASHRLTCNWRREGNFN